MIDFAQELNAEQLEAVKHTTSPLCVLAGAGSGKTRVITHRICYLVEELGVDPASILGVTFTNKAAQEMRQRVNSLLPGVGRSVLLGTFHGIAARMLRIYGSAIGVPANFVIYDEDDSKRLLKNIALDEFEVEKDAVDEIYKKISGWQNLHLEQAVLWSTADEKTKKILEIYRRYQDCLKLSGAVDFSGLLVKWRDLLADPASLEIVSARCQHMVVDEYQDTNSIQSQIVISLGQRAQSLAVVGDDDQSIYGWRGAQPGNLKEFLSHFANTQLVKLEKNYRSTATILRAADKIIEKNSSRIGKKLVPVNGTGDPIKIIQAYSDREEAAEIARFLELQLRAGYAFDSMALLMRTNSLSRSFEEVFQRNQIPYRVIGGQRFYDRKEIKDVLATLRAAINHSSDVDLLRALAAIPRGIGESSLKKARTAAFARSLSLFDILGNETILSELGVAKKARTGALAFVAELSALGREISPSGVASEALPADAAVARAIEVSGLTKKLLAHDDQESSDRLENLDQLLAAAQAFVDDAQLQGVEDSVIHFLEGASLMSSADGTQSLTVEQGTVSLLTLHAAKGLEFDIVCMVGMEEGCFPHPRALGQGATSELEEERRLAYVGITRARKRLALSWAGQRMVHGTVQKRQPSRFLRDLPPDLVIGTVPAYGAQVEEKRSYAWTRPLPDRVSGGVYQPGSSVWHKLYGNGTVLENRPAGGNQRISVRFVNDPSIRVILSQYLQII